MFILQANPRLSAALGCLRTHGCWYFKDTLYGKRFVSHGKASVDGFKQQLFILGSIYNKSYRIACSSNIPRYFLDFAFYHYPCTTAGGQVVPEGTCRVVILYDRTMLFEYPSVLSRFCFLPQPMYHRWWTSCPRGYLSGSIFI